MNSTLSVSALSVAVGGKTVVNNVSLTVAAGEVVSLLGPNGAGKSELVLAVAGVIPKTAGSVSVNGADISALAPQKVREAGVAAVPEGHQVLAGLTVDDNLAAAGAALASAELELSKDEAYGVFPELRPLSRQAAGSLSGGQQQMVALAQALVSRPRFLLIDEMSLGLAPVIIERLVDVVLALKARPIGIMLIEQFTHLALEISDRCYVINQGRIQYEGSPDRLKSDPEILHSAYLGVSEPAAVGQAVSV
ncbi:ABC transporter ATP-binding protein [Nitratireductor sp. XY-223]|uniref:ABC transporter ATP-binding protein n=1 Tax=Nitratireductor sp. XY-223 TaxID=2561926 RepID=UPI0010AB0F8B|nr:ABC transporter ATP-binding protein [Nitratireductor sp. XY-223]